MTRDLSRDVLLGLQAAAGNHVVREVVEARRGRSPGCVHVSSEGIGTPWSPWQERLDLWLSALPRMRIDVAGCSLPAFKTTTIAALLAAFAAGWVFASLAGVRPHEWAIAWLATTLLLVVVLFLHRLINYAFQAVASVGFLAAGVALPGTALAMLDVGAVALAIATGVGRIGCACAGCCHGRPASMGLRYGVEHVRGTFPTRLAGVPLLPVQLIESVMCVAMVPVLVVVIATTPDGGAFVAWALAYAWLRWFTEGLRGDGRPRVMGVSQARWTSAAVGAGTLVLAGIGTLPVPTFGRAAAGGLLIALAVEVARWKAGRSLPTMLGDFTSWDGLASALNALTCDPAQDDLEAPPTVTTPDGVRLSLTRTGGDGGTCTAWGLSSPGVEGGEDRIRATAAAILDLRHPGVSGTLLHGAHGVSVLVVGGPDPADPLPMTQRSSG